MEDEKIKSTDLVLICDSDGSFVKYTKVETDNVVQYFRIPNPYVPDAWTNTTPFLLNPDELK